MKTGTALAGRPGSCATATPRRPSTFAAKLTSSASTIGPNRSTPPPPTCIRWQRDGEAARIRRPRGRAPRARNRRGSEPVGAASTPPREARLEVRGDPEAGEHPQRRRLQQHEHELERRVAGGGSSNPGHVAHVREPAREGGEEEQREDQRRQQELRVGPPSRGSSARPRRSATSAKRLTSAPGACAGPDAEPSTPRQRGAPPAKPKPSVERLRAPAEHGPARRRPLEQVGDGVAPSRSRETSPARSALRGRCVGRGGRRARRRAARTPGTGSPAPVRSPISAPSGTRMRAR